MKAPLLLLLLAMMFTLSAGAQHTHGLAGNLRFGLSHLPNASSSLQAIAPEGIGGFHNTFYGYGLEGYYRNGSSIFALDGFFGIQQPHSFRNDQSNAYTGGLHARMGLVVKEGEQYWIYPSLGLGSELLALSTSRNMHKADENNYTHILHTPVIDIGLNADFLAARRVPGETVSGGQMIGLRMGYSFSPTSAHWPLLNWEKTVQAPPYQHRVYYLSVSVGVGAFTRK
jgi:hypothetical protein